MGSKLVLNPRSWSVSCGLQQKSHRRLLEIALDDDVALRGDVARLVEGVSRHW